MISMADEGPSCFNSRQIRAVHTCLEGQLFLRPALISAGDGAGSRRGCSAVSMRQGIAPLPLYGHPPIGNNRVITELERSRMRTWVGALAVVALYAGTCAAQTSGGIGFAKQWMPWVLDQKKWLGYLQSLKRCQAGDPRVLQGDRPHAAKHDDGTRFLQHQGTVA